jgi:hypothetical protein
MARPAKGYRFIQQPPRADMKRKSPDSAPRLYEYLVDQGFVEPVNTVRRTNKREDRRRQNARSIRRKRR